VWRIQWRSKQIAGTPHPPDIIGKVATKSLPDFGHRGLYGIGRTLPMQSHGTVWSLTSRSHSQDHDLSCLDESGCGLSGFQLHFAGGTRGDNGGDLLAAN